MTGTAMECIAYLSMQKDGQAFDVEPHKEKRSLSANAYYWQLIEKITNERRKDDPKVTKDEVHYQMLHDYGTWEHNPDGSAKWAIFPIDQPLPTDGYYWDTKTIVKASNEKDTQLCKVYMVIKGTHNYNSKEMNELIKGVVQEAQNLGIETRTPQEIEQMIRDMEKTHK